MNPNEAAPGEGPLIARPAPTVPGDHEILIVVPVPPPDTGGADLLEGLPAELPGDLSAPPRRPRRARPPSPGFWESILWLAAYLVGFSVIVEVAALVPTTILLLQQYDSAEDILRLVQSGNWKRSTAFVQIVHKAHGWGMAFGEPLTLALAWLVIRLRVGKDWTRKLAFGVPAAGHLFLAFMALPGVVVTANVVYQLLVQLGVPTFRYQGQVVEMVDSWPLWVGVLILGLGPGCIEELWFRGFIGRGLVGRFGTLAGILLTSLWFGLAHLDPPHVVAVGILGLSLHVVYLWTRSLWVPIVMHVANNSLSVLMVKLGHESAETETAAPLAVSVSSFVLLACAAWALHTCRARLVSRDPEQPLNPTYTSVESPLPESGTVVVRPPLRRIHKFAVLAAFVLFIGSLFIEDLIVIWKQGP